MKANLMCIGAAKSGTTWLAEVLNQHPDIFIHPKKEIHYFNHFHPITQKPNINRKKGHSWYNELFKEGASKKIIADFSTSYLQKPSISSELKEYNSDVKVMVILRNPIDRAISDHHFLYSRGLIKEADLIEAFNKHKTIRDTGNYYSLLKPFYEDFNKERLRVFFFEQLKEPDIFLDEICHFLTVECIKFDFSLVNQNKTKNVSSVFLHNSVTILKTGKIGQLIVRSGLGGFFNRFYDWNTTENGDYKVKTNQLDFLKNYYSTEIARLEELLGKKTGWLDNTGLLNR